MDIEARNQRVMQSTGVCDEFKEDYKAIVTDLLSDSQNLQQAEKSLLYWSGLVPDTLMQDGLVSMRYTYLMHVLQKKS
jgi:hypothetical protein